MDKIIGVVFPVPHQFLDRILVENRNIFVKYIPRPNSIKIKPKHKILFYASRHRQEIVGEGRIEEIEYLNLKQALDKYGNKIFLNEDELLKYALKQPNRDITKSMLVVVLSKIKKYPTPIKPNIKMTMAGYYLTKEEYEKLNLRNLA